MKVTLSSKPDPFQTKQINPVSLAGSQLGGTPPAK